MFGYLEASEWVVRLGQRGANAGIIGYSLLGRAIPYIKIGFGSPTIIITAAIHAREWAGGYLAVRQAEFALNETFSGTAYFVPLVNPDGVEIVHGRATPPTWFRGEQKEWKANARGVDLNVNFDAKFGFGKDNAFIKGSQNYVGEYAFSEPESKALRDFTLKIKPDATVSYHTKGREIYFDFFQGDGDYERDKRIAERINERLSYKIVEKLRSAGGYKDWCISRLQIPSLTIELGDDHLTHPLCENDITEDIRRNIDLPLRLIDAVKRKKTYEKSD